tara:strand:- start:33252 stop:33440 length:189 start_codon:yes stop_codon:yes gene_type:complete
MENQYIYWKCEKCNSYQKSDEKQEWTMDWCKCGNSAVDADELIHTTHGSVITITKEEYLENK